MTTVTGPLCFRCHGPVVRIEYKNQHGYVHGYWRHAEPTECEWTLTVRWELTNA